MGKTAKKPAPVVIEKIEEVLEERKMKTDRRQTPEVRLPASVERRSNPDRRAQA